MGAGGRGSPFSVTTQAALCWDQFPHTSTALMKRKPLGTEGRA